MSRSLYDHDFVLWSEQQADGIRHAAASGTNLPLDWESLAEEIGSLGKSVRSELRSSLGTVIEHVLKLEHSPAAEPRAGWIDVAPLIDGVHARRSELAALGLDRSGERDGAGRRQLLSARHGPDQVIGEWLPRAPG